MKGYTKKIHGKNQFIPTSRTKSGLKKSDIRKKRFDIFTGSKQGDVLPQMKEKKEKEVKGSSPSPLATISTPLPVTSKPKGALPQQGLASKSIKGIGKLLGKANEQRKEIDKRKQQEIVGLQKLNAIIDKGIDSILDNHNTSVEQKFRQLQRFGIDNDLSLTNQQRFIINNSLKILEQESQNKTPSTFISAVQSSKGLTSTSRIGSKKTESEIKNLKPAQPIQLLSGQFATPTEFENQLNQAKLLNPSLIPSTGNTVLLEVTPSTNRSNLDAEINAILG